MGFNPDEDLFDMDTEDNKESDFYDSEELVEETEEVNNEDFMEKDKNHIKYRSFYNDQQYEEEDFDLNELSADNHSLFHNFFSSKLYTFLIFILILIYLFFTIGNNFKEKNISSEDIQSFTNEFSEEVVHEFNQELEKENVSENVLNKEIEMNPTDDLKSDIQSSNTKEIKIPSDKLANINHFIINDDDYDVNLYAGYIYDFNSDGSLQIQTSSGIYQYYLISNTNINSKDLKKYLEKNQKIYLEYDSNKYDDDLNCYAYIWLDVPDGDNIDYENLLLNYILIKDGVSDFEFSKFNKKYLNQLSKAEDENMINISKENK